MRADGAPGGAALRRWIDRVSATRTHDGAAAPQLGSVITLAMSSSPAIELRVSLQTPAWVGQERTDRLTRQLREELRDSGLHAEFAPTGDPLPLGAKGVDPDSLNTLLIGLTASGGIVTSALGILQAWLGRQRKGSRLRIQFGDDSLELEGESTSAQREMIASFIARHDHYLSERRDLL